MNKISKTRPAILLASATLAVTFLTSCASGPHSANSSNSLAPANTIVGVSEAQAEEVLGIGKLVDPSALLPTFFPNMKPGAGAAMKLRQYERGGLDYFIWYHDDFSVQVHAWNRDKTPLSGRQLNSLLRCTAGGASWIVESPMPGFTQQWARSDGVLRAITDDDNRTFMAGVFKPLAK